MLNGLNELTHITVGIDQISSMVQTNSAISEESAVARKELSGQVQVLKDIVGRFRQMTQARYNSIYSNRLFYT